jgi:arginine/lysine/ornithine decarboxylase
MAIDGKSLLTETLRLSKEVRSQLNQIPNLRTFDQREVATLDPTRLTVMLEDLGISGFEADLRLHSELAVMAEMPTLNQLVFILSLGNTQADIQRLIYGFQQLSKGKEKRKKEKIIRNYELGITNYRGRITPREAYFAKSDRISIDKAIGRVSAESLCPYPPGIPLLCIGEEITLEVVEMLQYILRSGGIINGASDDTLDTIRVVK